MTQDEKKDLLKSIFQGADLKHAQINVFVESGAKVVYQEVKEQAPVESSEVSDEQMMQIIGKIQSHFWAQSSWAVLFCVCRDSLGMSDNMTEFERYISRITGSMQLEYACTPGTVQKTLNNNPYMKLSIDRWQEKNAKPRVLALAEMIKSELDKEKESF